MRSAYNENQENLSEKIREELDLARKKEMPLNKQVSEQLEKIWDVETPLSQLMKNELDVIKSNEVPLMIISDQLREHKLIIRSIAASELNNIYGKPIIDFIKDEISAFEIAKKIRYLIGSMIRKVFCAIWWLKKFEI